VGTAAVAVTSKPEILAQPITQATTAVAAETTKAIYDFPIRTIGSMLFFVALLILVSGVVCITRHYLKLWHILPLVAMGIFLCFGCIAEAGVINNANILPIATVKATVIMPLINFVGWVVVIVVTTFL
jgi:hypothetical protein